MKRIDAFRRLIEESDGNTDIEFEVLYPKAGRALPYLLNIAEAAAELVGWEHQSSSVDPRQDAVLRALDAFSEYGR
jgi:hypothetical protein